MSDQFKFRRAETDEKIIEVAGLTSEPFFPHMTPEQAGKSLLEVIKKRDQKTEVYYFEHAKTLKPVSLVQVVYSSGFFKDVDKGISSSSVNPDTFGIDHVKILTLSTVVTASAYRQLGLANKLITSVMDYVEKSLIHEHIEKSDPTKKDSFASMVQNNKGEIDQSLANYYLGKKYFWNLYSAVGNFYERFGFKGFQAEMYKVPTTIVQKHQKDLLNALLGKGDSNPANYGKKLKLLDTTNKNDIDLISFIFQSHELEILTELNKSISHSELSSGRKSSSSLTSMTELLTMSKLTSQTELTSISENAAKPISGRRKSSIVEHPIAKVAIKPSLNHFEVHNLMNSLSFAAKSGVTEEQKKFEKIGGAIFTNDLQQKSHFILWADILGHLVIIGVGELQFNMFGAMADPMGKGGVRSRRGSSFSGLNELGGYNFQDLDILFSTACYVAQERYLLDNSAVYVTVSDLPNSIPPPMLNDYFMNYLPRNFESTDSNETSSATGVKVEFITDASSKLGILPMIRKFGAKSPNFDLDWVANGMWAWG